MTRLIRRACVIIKSNLEDKPLPNPVKRPRSFILKYGQSVSIKSGDPVMVQLSLLDPSGYDSMHYYPPHVQ